MSVTQDLCTVDKTTKAAYCINKTLDDIPKDLDADIEVLNLTSSTINSILTGHSFERYIKLKILTLRNCLITTPDKKVSTDDTVFKGLRHLEELDLSGLKQNGFPQYTWPSSIRFLYLNNTHIKPILDATSILALEYCDLSYSEITIFPIFNVKAPLKTLLMTSVNLEKISVDDLAPYCRVTFFEITSPVFGSEAHACDCHKINAWKRKIGILYDTVIQCPGGTEKEHTCDLNFETQLAARRKCFGGDVRNTSMLMLFAVIFLILLTLTTLALAYRYANLRYHLHLAHSAVAHNLSEEDEEEMGETEEDSV